jgi:hypothetical protein
LEQIIHLPQPVLLQSLLLTAARNDQAAEAELRLYSPQQSVGRSGGELPLPEPELTPASGEEIRLAGYWIKDGRSGRVLLTPDSGLVIVLDEVRKL